MDKDTIVVAAVGAVVATGVTLAVNYATQLLHNQDRQVEVNAAWMSGREQGYTEGQQTAGRWTTPESPTKLHAVQ